jgi:hypothetical protein
VENNPTPFCLVKTGPFFPCPFATPRAYNIGNSPANLRSRDRAALLKAKFLV